MDNKRTDSARDHDDSALIDAAEDAPSTGSASGGNLHRDIGSHDEMQDALGRSDGITRVGAKDKPEEADLPRFNER